MESPYVYDPHSTHHGIPNMLSFQHDPQLIICFIGSHKVYQGLPNQWNNEVIRGKKFSNLQDLQQCIDPQTEFSMDNFYLIDKTKQVITSTTMSAVKSKTKRPQPKKHVISSKPIPSTVSTPTNSGLANENDVIEMDHSNEHETNESHETKHVTAATTIPISTSIPVTATATTITSASIPVTATTDLRTPVSIFKSTETIGQRYKPDEASIVQVNRYDQTNPSFLCRSWLSELSGGQKNIRWSPIASCFVIFYYISRVLKWPLEETRVVWRYDRNAVRFDSVIGQVYKMYNIEERLRDSNILTQLLVWCIASMNSFGIIRPLLFKGTSENCHRLGEMCASRQRYERIMYYITWPFRVDSHKVYVIRNRTKLHEFQLKTTFLSDMHSDKNLKKILKEIPDWVYNLQHCQ